MAGIEFKPLDKGTYDYYKKYTQRNENAEYWINRTFKAEAMAEKTSDQLLRDMIEVYKKSYKELEREIEAFYGRYATENGLSLAEVHKRLDPRQLKSALEEIKRYYDFAKPEKIGKNMSREYRDELRRLSARAYMSRLEEIKMKMKQIVVKLAAEEKTHFDKSLKQIYSQAHSQASYNIDKGLGFSEGYSAPSEEALEKIVSQKWLDSNYSDRIWQDKGKLLTAIEQELLSGIAQGHNPRKIAGAMSDLYGMNYKNCERLARTETIHYFNEATSDSYKEHGIEEYQFVCSLDERTCPECGALDGEVFDLKYKVEGVNYPVIHPNCYDSETVVLTKDGWKLFKDCTDNDEYLSANPKNPKQMKFIKAKKRISYLYKGSMIQFSGDGFTCRVTENHNMFVLSDIKLKFYRLYTRPFFISAKELYEKFKKKNFFVYANDIEYIRSVKYQPNREEMVYCVELPEWHTLLVRRNGGFPVWCGNCRCTTIPYFEPDEIDKMFDETSRAAYDDDHKIYEVPASMSYKEWKEKYGSGDIEKKAVETFNEKVNKLEHIKNNPNWAYQPDSKVDLKDMVKNPIPFVGDGNDWKIGERIENAIQPDYKSNVPIDISTLKTLQPFVLKSGLENYKRFDETERPYIVNFEGENYVMDGNHRIAIAKLKGEKTINVDISIREEKK